MNTNVCHTLIVKRLIKAPRERVFAAWMNPAELMRWFGPETCQALSAQLDPRVGGAYRIRIRSELMGEAEVSGVYREVSPPSRLAFTWKWSGNPQLEFGETRVAVDFLAVDGGTDVHITHEGLPNAELRDDHTDGWNGCLDKLEKFLGLPCRQQPPLRTFCWNELLTSDVPAAARFYTQLLDWQTAETPMEGFTYTLFKKEERGVGGFMPVPQPHLPPHWMSHLRVADVDATAQKASALGGKVLKVPFDIPKVGRLAILQDPQGAVFGVFKPLAE